MAGCFCERGWLIGLIEEDFDNNEEGGKKKARIE